MSWTEKHVALLLLLRSVECKDKSCFEEGEWVGGHIFPNGSIGYPEEFDHWDLKDEDYDFQPAICEKIRVRMGGVEWIMERDNLSDEADCSVLSPVRGVTENPDYIRSVLCTGPPTENPTSSQTDPTSKTPSVSLTLSLSDNPSWSLAEALSENLTKSQSRQTDSPSKTPNFFPTSFPTNLPTQTQPKSFFLDEWYYIVSLVLILCLLCVVIKAYFWMRTRERYIEERQRPFLKAKDKIAARTHREKSLTRSSTSSAVSIRGHLRLSTGRTLWGGTLDDCSIDDEDLIERRFGSQLFAKESKSSSMGVNPNNPYPESWESAEVFIVQTRKGASSGMESTPLGIAESEQHEKPHAEPAEKDE